jgi:isopentenyl diphosphate isomerase/L-lactate dehydrogenase-like FMN-dependent dehydrogenase
MIPMTLSINVRRGNKQAAVAVVAFGIVVVLIISASTRAVARECLGDQGSYSKSEKIWANLVQAEKHKVKVDVNEDLSHEEQTVSSILHKDNPTQVPWEGPFELVHLP